MNVAAPSPIADEQDTFPVARIDAQDVAFVLPLREFLESNGVRVFVNENPNREPLYHIAVGDQSFVKHFFSHAASEAAKRLAIIVGGGGAPRPQDIDAKIFLVDPSPMGASRAREIFEFFFTGDSTLVDVRNHKEGHVPVVKDVPPEVEEAKDTARIGSIIQDVFGPEKKDKPKRRRKTPFAVRALFFVVAILILSVMWYALSLGASAVSLGAAAGSLEKGDTKNAGWQLSSARYWTQQGTIVLHAWSWPLSFVGAEAAVRGQERLLSFLTDAEHAASQIQVVAESGKRVASGLLNQVDVTSIGTTSASDIGDLRTSVLSAQNTLGLAQAQLAVLLQERTFPFSLAWVSNRGTHALDTLATLRNRTANVDKLLSLFLQLSGFNGPKTYLILLQNSMELRPTGGFIGSVAVASFADGRLTNLEVQDVYVYDGQLKGHVDPPLPIREILASEHWYLRDSNWDPDFFASGTRAAWFFEKETGTVVDGVIAVNVPFVARLLAATGPIDLPDYDDRITTDNFYGKALYYTQQDFFPGSTQKKDFLGGLTRALMEKTTSGKGVNATALFTAITTSLDAHDILFMFGKDELQNLVEHYGWAGRVPSHLGCMGASSGCLFHPLATVEANLGVNKGSYFIKRELNRDLTIDEQGIIHEKATLTLTNTSGGETPIPYHAYVRFLPPTGSLVGEVTVNGGAISSRTPGQKQPAVPYVERTEEGTMGVAIDIPPGTSVRLLVSYDSTVPLVFNRSGALLEVFDQKQPGVDNMSAHVTVSYPMSWTAGVEDAGAQSHDFIAKEGKLEYNTILTRDLLTRIRLTR